MELESLGNMFWFLLGALSYSILSRLFGIYKLVSIFKDIEKCLINLLKVLDNNYHVFINLRKRIAEEVAHEKEGIIDDVKVIERFDNLQYTIWRKNVLLKFFSQIPSKYISYLEPSLKKELTKLSKELNDANIRMEK